MGFKLCKWKHGRRQREYYSHKRICGEMSPRAMTSTTIKFNASSESSFATLEWRPIRDLALVMSDCNLQGTTTSFLMKDSFRQRCRTLLMVATKHERIRALSSTYSQMDHRHALESEQEISLVACLVSLFIVVDGPSCFKLGHWKKQSSKHSVLTLIVERGQGFHCTRFYLASILNQLPDIGTLPAIYDLVSFPCHSSLASR